MNEIIIKYIAITSMILIGIILCFIIYKKPKIMLSDLDFRDRDDFSFLYRDYEYRTKHCNAKWSKGTFGNFLNRYKKIEWTRNKKFIYSHFGPDESNLIHFNNIRFDNVGMLLDRVDYRSFKEWEELNAVKIDDREIKMEW